jgi:hypothetical protein
MRIAALCVVAFVSLGSVYFSVADETVDKTSDIRTLLTELHMNQREIAAAKKAMVDLEVSKQLALQQARSISTLDTAVQEELAKDQMLQHYMEQLYMIDMQIADVDSTSKRSNSPQLKRLRQLHYAAEQDLQKYRVTKEREIRERLKGAPNDLLAQKMTEYALKKGAIRKRLAELENVPTMSEEDIQAISNERLRKVISALYWNVKELELRVYDLEEANKPRIVPCESQ